MILGSSNIILGFGILGAGIWRLVHDTGSTWTMSFLVAGAGAVSVGVYQIWRHHYVYNNN